MRPCARASEIAGPDTRDKSKLRMIRKFHRLILILEGHDGQDRSEYLLTRKSRLSFETPSYIVGVKVPRASSFALRSNRRVDP